MTVRVIHLKDLGRHIKEFTSRTIEQQKAAVIRGLARSIPDLVERSPIDTGYYANSWHMTYDEKKALIGNTAPHAPIIEWGARPFRPPLGPLLAWAKRVLQDPSQPPDYSPQVFRLAVGTQRKIEREGMSPKMVLTDALDMMIDNIRAELGALTYE